MPTYFQTFCRYADSQDSDWVIGYYPSDSGLLLATSGSGHGYKVIHNKSPPFSSTVPLITFLQFLPVIGRIVSDAIEGKLEPAIAQKFAVDRKHWTVEGYDPSRGTLKPVDLLNEPLCTPEDLLPCLGEANGRN